MPKKNSKHRYIGAGTKTHGKGDVVYAMGRLTKVSGSGRTGGKRVARKCAGK